MMWLVPSVLLTSVLVVPRAVTATVVAARDPRDDLVIGNMVSFEAVNYPRHYIHSEPPKEGHKLWLRDLVPRSYVNSLAEWDSDDFRKSASFIVREPLVDDAGENCFSFESVYRPEFYINHWRNFVRVDHWNITDHWDATWCIQISPNDENAIIFNNLGLEGHCVGHRGILWMEETWEDEHDNKRQNDCSFWILPALMDVPPEKEELDMGELFKKDRVISLESVNYPGHYIAHSPQEPKINLHTPKNGKYYAVVNLVDGEWKAEPVHFQVKAWGDVFIGLFGETDLVMPSERFEIRLGWPKSSIRFGDKAVAGNSGLADAKKYRDIWIKVEENKVSVGTGVDEEPFMVMEGQDTSFIKTLAVMTKETVASWLFDSSSVLTLYTAVDEKYRTVTRVFQNSRPNSKNGITFQVKAESDAHVGLFPSFWADTNGPFYEIVIAAKNHAQSAIRRGRNKKMEVKKQTKGLLSADEFRTFTVQQVFGTVRLFKGNDVKNMENLILEWNDPEPLKISSIGCMTTNGAEGVWKFPQLMTGVDIIDRDQVTAMDQFYPRATWIVRPPLAEGAGEDCFTLESADVRGSYLKIADSGNARPLLVQSPFPNKWYQASATWCPFPGKAGRGVTLQSFDTTRWIRHKGFVITADTKEYIEKQYIGRRDASFVVVDGLAEVSDAESDDDVVEIDVPEKVEPKPETDDEESDSDDEVVEIDALRKDEPEPVTDKEEEDKPKPEVVEIEAPALKICGDLGCQLSGKAMKNVKGKKFRNFMHENKENKDEPNPHMSCGCETFCASVDSQVWSLATKGKKTSCACYKASAVKKVKKKKSDASSFMCISSF